MNYLIQKFIEPNLPLRKTFKLRDPSNAKYFEKYDTSRLVLQNEYFYKLDFAIKFMKINKGTCNMLILKDLAT